MIHIDWTILVLSFIIGGFVIFVSLISYSSLKTRYTESIFSLPDVSELDKKQTWKPTHEPTYSTSRTYTRKTVTKLPKDSKIIQEDSIVELTFEDFVVDEKDYNTKEKSTKITFKKLPDEGLLLMREIVNKDGSTDGQMIQVDSTDDKVKDFDNLMEELENSMATEKTSEETSKRFVKGTEQALKLAEALLKEAEYDHTDGN